MRSDYPFVAIVDCFSSALALVPALGRHGYKCVHVRSTPDLPPIYLPTHRPELFERTIIHRGNLDATCEAICGATAVLAGAEMGVELADQISERLELASNGTRLSPARRNKVVMAEVLEAGGRHVPIQLRCTTWEEAIRWVVFHFGPAPWVGKFVIKPVDSAGGDKVFSPTTEPEFRLAFETVTRIPNLFGRCGGEALLQERLTGIEYQVQTVSHRRRHICTDIWRVHKAEVNGAPFVYDHLELLAPNGSLYAHLQQETFLDLDALGIGFGPGHTERREKTGEIAARLPGLLPRVSGNCTGRCQVELTVAAYVAPDQFQLAAELPASPLRQHARIVSLIARREGKVNQLPRIDLLKGLPTFIDTTLRLQVGEVVQPTVDMATTPGWVFLVGPTSFAVDMDVKKIRQYEADGELGYM